MSAPVQPTGETHEVGVDEMFFSTTDARGVIEQANSVFVKLSRHPLERLVGAPHNIIRHPDMPGGAFRLTWDMLKADVPTCAYVKNLAADGSTYWAFATMVPVPGGFLSVRTRPSRTDLREAADNIYARVRGWELQARLDGESAADSAEKGAVWVEQELADAGFDSYLDFILTVLPAEVAAHAEASSGLPVRPQATGALAEMLGSLTATKSVVDALAAELDTFQSQAEVLRASVATAGDLVTKLDTVLDDATATVELHAKRGPVLASSVPALHTQNDNALASLRALHDHVEEIRMRRAELRFNLALCQLQTAVVASFVAEMIDGAHSGTSADLAIATLTGALQEGLVQLAADLRWNIETAASMSQEIGAAREAFAQMQSLLSHWRLLVPRYGLSDEFSSHMPTLDSHLRGVVDALSAIAAEAGQFTTAAVGFDVQLLLDELAIVRGCLDQVTNAAAR